MLAFISVLLFCFFFFNDTATTEIYTLSLHDALPIWLSGISIKNYLSYVKINKLILLISLIMITILSQYLKLIPAFPAVFSLSILSGIFFFSDIKLLFKNKLKFGF